MESAKHAREDNKANNKTKYIGLCVSIVIIIIVVVFCIYKITYTEEYANKKMTKLVTKYYERDLKENTVGVGRLIVTLQTLKDADFNIRGVKGKPGVSKDLNEAFSYIIIENLEETDIDKIVYTIENHLNGE